MVFLCFLPGSCCSMNLFLLVQRHSGPVVMKWFLMVYISLVELQLFFVASVSFAPSFPTQNMTSGGTQIALSVF